MYYLYNVETNEIVTKFNQLDSVASLKGNFNFTTEMVEDSRDIPFKYWFRFFYNSETNAIEPL